MVFLIIIASTAVLQIWFPWWIVIFPSLLTGGWKIGSAHLAAFRNGGAIFLLWYGYAFLLNWENSALLSTRIAGMFSLPAGWLVPVVTGLVGGIIGAASGWLGFECARWWRSR